jgi:xanthine dehydrogenase accessory factor
MTRASPDRSADLDAVTAAAGFLDETGGVALVTVIDTWGSAPVPVGGQMAVAADGRFAGSVSGGCIEADIVVAAEDALRDGATRVLAFGVADETAWRVGLPCGGQIRVMVEPMAGAADRHLLADLAGAAARRRLLVVATPLPTSGASVGPAAVRAARRLLGPDDIAREIAHGRVPADTAWRLRGGDSRLVAAADGETFYRTYAPPARLVVVGATHIAQSLVALARIAGYGVVVVDPRDAYATPERFPGVEIVAEGPAAAMAAIGLDAFTAVVALAHVVHIDDAALDAALRSKARYVGVLGSRKNRDKRRARLLAAGFTAADVDRIRSPIGLDIGAVTPAEIAVAILAEVIETVRGKRWT